ncbi:MAG TPA: hypothetical protein VH297_12755 [Gaiellaceae bacterium]|jgi:hypothetical protein
MRRRLFLGALVAALLALALLGYVLDAARGLAGLTRRPQTGGSGSYWM